MAGYWKCQIKCFLEYIFSKKVLKYEKERSRYILGKKTENQKFLNFDIFFGFMTTLERDIYVAYKMIVKVISDLKDTRENIEENFTNWFEFAVQMSESVGAEQKCQELPVAGVDFAVMLKAKMLKVITRGRSASHPWMML